MLRISAPIAPLLVAVISVTGAHTAHAQVHFQDCVSMTGSSANVIVPTSIDPTVNDEPIADGDEIAVYTPDGLCAGSAVWTGGNLFLTAWGDDAISPDTDGFVAGDALVFRVWDASADTEAVDVTVTYDGSQPFYRTDGTYGDNALLALASFGATYETEGQLPAAPVLAIPMDGAQDVTTTPMFIWSTATGAEAYHLEVSEDSTFETLWTVIPDLTVTHYGLLDLTAKTHYFWRVRAENDAGSSSYSLVQSFTTDVGQQGPNVAPSFTTSPLLQVTSGTPYSYEVLTEDANGDEVTLMGVELPSWLSLEADGASGMLEGTPTPVHVGSHAVVLRVEDPLGASVEQSFTILVKPSGAPNSAPVVAVGIADQSLNLATGAKTIDLGAHFQDADLDPLAFSVHADQTGIVDVRVTGETLTLTPRRRGAVSLAITAQDGAGGSVALDFTASVSGNRSPSAKPETRTLREDSPLEISVLDNDTDPDGDLLSISIATAPRNGKAEVVGSLVLYTPASEYTGADSFIYRISDGFGGSASAVVYLEISEANDAPFFNSSDPITSPEDGAEIFVNQETIASGEAITISWLPATDAEREAVQYRWQVSHRADFSTFLSIIDVPPTGSYSQTHAQVNEILNVPFLPASGAVTLYHRILASDGRATTESAPRSLVVVRGQKTGAEHEQPGQFALGQNYPNPFNPRTTIDYEIDRAGPATLTLFDVLGREVAILASGVHDAGRHSVQLDASNLQSGLYVYRLSAGGQAAARTAVLMK